MISQLQADQVLMDLADHKLEGNTRAYINQPVSYAEVYSGLLALGFEHLDRFTFPESCRIPSRGKTDDNRDTWVSGSHDSSCGHWCEHNTGAHGTIFSEHQRYADPIELATLRAKSVQQSAIQRAETERLQNKTATRARLMFEQASNRGTHSHLEVKQIGLHCARIHRDINAVGVPIWNPELGLVNLQLIFLDGTKRFLKHGRKHGCYCIIGTLDDALKILIAEGFATGASLHELHGHPVVVAFDAGNLLSVSKSIRAQHPDISIVIAGDDDRLKEYNVGRHKAIQAAKAVGGTVAFPELCKCCTCTDHNDAAICLRRCGRG